MDPMTLAFILGLVTVASASALMGVGIYVVKKYPNTTDPARNAKRFTVPAGILLFVGSFALAGMIGSLITAIVNATT